MKILYMGTPDFAVAALESLIAAGHEIVAVVTQPDKPKGRSAELVFSPVKECALRHNLPVMQPVRIKRPEAIEELKKYEADVYVVAAFGQILSQEILDMPKYGCINIHASLLPRFRGSSPIQHAIIEGDAKSGVTIMKMDIGVDTGDMLYKKEVAIEDTDTYETLHDKLMVVGGEAIVEYFELFEQGKITPIKQDDSLSTHAPMIEKNMGKLDFTKSAVTLDRLIRGLTPWPSAFTYYNGKQLKIWKAEAFDEKTEKAPGTIAKVEKDAVYVATGEGLLRITELQLEGKKRMSAHDFLLGVKMTVGEML